MKFAVVFLFFCALTFSDVRLTVSVKLGNAKILPGLIGLIGNLLNQNKNFTYDNWATDRVVPNLWKLVAQTPDDVVTIANYAAQNGLRVRALGQMHNWSPLTVLDSTDTSKVILVDTSQLTTMSISSTSGSTGVAKIQAGALMQDILAFLEQNNYALVNTPAPGDLTIGGVIAIDGHGTAIPAIGENLPEGYTYGSISNLIVSLTAVVWDSPTSAYVLKKFNRGDTEIKALLTNLGKTFLTEVELRVGPLYNLRCVSYIDVPSSELFASPSSANASTRTFASYLDQSGRVETILYPFTDNPWLKVWTIAPVKPDSSRAVTAPFNYPFSDIIPEQVSDLYSLIQKGIVSTAPLLGATMYSITATGLTATNSFDIWGPAKNTLLYIRPTTLRVTANGYAVLTRRANIQNVISTVFAKYTSLSQQYKANGDYPANGPLEIRVTGLDHPEDVGIAGAESPTLSAIRPDDNNPQFDVAIWFDILSVPGTAKANEFLTVFESFFLNTFNIGDGITMMRPEWSKGWAYTNQGAWLNETLLHQTIPQLHSTTSSQDGWTWALSILNKYDPENIFTNEFLSKFLV